MAANLLVAGLLDRYANGLMAVFVVRFADRLAALVASDFAVRFVHGSAHGVVAVFMAAHRNALAHFVVAFFPDRLVARLANGIFAILPAGLDHRLAHGVIANLEAANRFRSAAFLHYRAVTGFDTIFITSLAFRAIASLLYRSHDRLLDFLGARMPAFFQNRIIDQLIAGLTLLLTRRKTRLGVTTRLLACRVSVHA